jgi:hypothetical protein
MLWTLLASALLLAGRVAAQCSGTGQTQSGNNYVVDYFTGTLLFSYAINQCTGISLLDATTWYKYTCEQDTDDMWWVTKTSYTSSSCSGTGTEIDSWSEADVGEAGTEGYFKCDGVDNYAGVEISVDTSCAAAVAVYGGLGGCAQNPASYDTKFYCDATSALVQLYLNPTTFNISAPICDDNILYCNKWTFGTECALSASLGTTPVYGKMISCSVTDTTSTESTSSATSHFTVLSLIVALVASMMH